MRVHLLREEPAGGGEPPLDEGSRRHQYLRPLRGADQHPDAEPARLTGHRVDVRWRAPKPHHPGSERGEPASTFQPSPPPRRRHDCQVDSRRTDSQPLSGSCGKPNRADGQAAQCALITVRQRGDWYRPPDRERHQQLKVIGGQQNAKTVTPTTFMFALIDTMSDENVLAEHLKERPVSIGWDEVSDAARCQLDRVCAHVLQRATHMITRLRQPG